MIKDDITVRIPNPHKSDIGKGLLAEILRQAGIEKDQWEQL
jgi:predicted RNA binding protein YcfA (HicA-like mRNA interferase family)